MSIKITRFAHEQRQTMQLRERKSTQSQNKNKPILGEQCTMIVGFLQRSHTIFAIEIW